MSKFSKAYQAPTHDEIAACARLIYEQEGRPEGQAMKHWLQAEAQLVAERKALAGMLPGKPAPAAIPGAKPTPAVNPAAAAPRSTGWQNPPVPRQHAHHN